MARVIFFPVGKASPGSGLNRAGPEALGAAEPPGEQGGPASPGKPEVMVEKRLLARRPSPPETPVVPTEPGRVRGAGSPWAGARPPLAGRAGSGGRGHRGVGGQTAKEEGVPEEGATSRGQRERRRQTGVPQAFLVPQAGGSVLLTEASSGAVRHVRPPPPRAWEAGGTPCRWRPSPSHPAPPAGRLLRLGPDRHQLQAASFPQQPPGALPVTSFVSSLLQPFVAENMEAAWPSGL